MKADSCRIRFVTPSDFDRLLRLVAAYYKFDSIEFNQRVTGRALRRLLREEALGRVWVIDAGTALAGYAILTYNYDLEFGGAEGMLTDLYVAARYRRRGLGAQVISAISEFCREAGIATIELQVSRGNRAARSFYRALGFKAWDRVVMSIDVKPRAGLR